MVSLAVAKEPKEVAGLIQGRQPGSIYEWRVAVALWKFKWEFFYQVSILGGRKLRGGQIIDFMVLTLPLPTPLYVQGEYWHGGPKADRDYLQRVLLTSVMHGQIQEPKFIYGPDCHTQATVDSAILRMFGRAN